MEEFGILRIKHIMMTVIALNRNIMYDDNLLHDVSYTYVCPINRIMGKV